LTKLLQFIIIEKYVNILALEMVSPGNRHIFDDDLRIGWLGNRVLDSGAEDPGSNRRRDAVG